MASGPTEVAAQIVGGATFMSGIRGDRRVRGRIHQHQRGGLGLAARLRVRTRASFPPMPPALFMTALVLLGFGCGASEGEPPRPRPLLSMTPSDLTSAVGAMPLQISIDNHSDAAGGELLAPIAAEVGLVSWPEGDPVPVTTALEEFEPRAEDGYQVFGSGKVIVTPSAPLEERWYFLYLPGAPPTVDLAGAPQLRKLADGRAGVRFTTGSDPQVTWVRRCLAEGLPFGKIVVDFSENVVLGSAQALTVEASGACTRPISDDTDLTGKSFTFACDGLSTDTPIRVFVADTVTGISGRPIRGAGLAVDFSPGGFAPGSDCSFTAFTAE